MWNRSEYGSTRLTSEPRLARSADQREVAHLSILSVLSQKVLSQEALDEPLNVYRVSPFVRRLGGQLLQYRSGYGAGDDLTVLKRVDHIFPVGHHQCRHRQ